MLAIKRVFRKRWTEEEIAAEVGCESGPAFNLAFKRQFSLSPARFRNQVKSDSKHVYNASTKVAAVRNDKRCVLLTQGGIR